MADATADPVAAQIEAFAVRVTEDVAAGFGALQLYLGSTLGVWAAMSPPGTPLTAQEVADKAGLAERYVRELLCSCATQGYVEYHPEGADDESLGKFSLPEAHAKALLDPAIAPFVRTCPGMLATCSSVLPQLLEAFRSGGGVPFEAYGPETVEAIAETNKATFEAELVHKWIPAMPDVEEVLTRGGVIADLGCGVGNSTIVAAMGFPACQVYGIDVDEYSIQRAREAAANQGLSTQRVAFHCGLADQVVKEVAGLEGGCDLVTLFECLHDMHNPVEALSAARRLAKFQTGAVLIADEKVVDRLEDMLPSGKSSEAGPSLLVGGPKTNNFLGRLNYGFSVLHCLPQAMVFPDSAGTGTCMGPKLLGKYARQAGWGGAKIVGETDAWWLYRLEW